MQKPLKDIDHQVFKLLCEGRMQKQVALELGISRSCVEYRTKKICQFYGVVSVIAALNTECKALRYDLFSAQLKLKQQEPP